MPINSSAGSNSHNPSHYGTGSFVSQPAVNPTYYSSSNGYHHLGTSATAPSAVPASSSAPASFRSAAAVPAAPAPAPKPKKQNLCCIGFVILITLCVAIAGVITGSYSIVSLSQFKTQFSVQKTFSLRPRISSSYSNSKLNAVSLVNNGNVAIGYGYRQADTATPYSSYAFTSDFKFTYLTGSTLVGARVVSGKLVISTFTQSSSSLYSNSEQTVTPYSVTPTQVLAVVNAKDPVSATSSYQLYYFTVLFLGNNNNLYACNGYYYSSSPSSFTMSSSVSTLFSFTSGYSRYNSFNATATALTDNAIAVAFSYGPYYTDGSGVTQILVYYPSSSVVLKDSTTTNCKFVSLATYNATHFFNLCDKSIYFYGASLTTATLSVVSSNSLSLPYDTMNVGPFIKTIPKTGSYFISYITGTTLKALITTPTVASYGSSVYFENDYNAFTIDSNLDATKGFEVTMASDIAIFFTYNKNGNTLLKQAIINKGTARYYSVTAEPGQLILSTKASPFPVVVYKEELDSYTKGSNVFLVHAFPLYTSNGMYMTLTEVTGGFYPIGVSYQTYSSDISVDVTLKGIVTVPSYNSLNAGSRYYVKRNGEVTLGNTEDDGTPCRVAGLAISETELLLSDLMQQ